MQKRDIDAPSFQFFLKLKYGQILSDLLSQGLEANGDKIWEAVCTWEGLVLKGEFLFRSENAVMPQHDEVFTAMMKDVPCSLEKAIVSEHCSDVRVFVLPEDLLEQGISIAIFRVESSFSSLLIFVRPGYTRAELDEIVGEVIGN